MNPIKTPQEMLEEMAGIPRMAGGGTAPKALTAGAAAIYNNLVKKATAVKRAPLNAKELAIIEQHASSLSMPTSKGTPTQPGRLEATTPAANHLVDQRGNAYRAVQGPRGLTTPEQAKGYELDPFGMSPGNMRAREEIIDNKPVSLYDDNVKAFEDRDPFLTLNTPGLQRHASGTRQKPFTTNIDDLVANRAKMESKGIYEGHSGTGPGDLPIQSTTPSADYFAERAAALENAKLPDNLVSALRKELGRQPTQDEINSLIADLNVMNMDYTGKGPMSFALRPEMPKGRPNKAKQAEIDNWKQFGIDSGQKRSAVDASNYDLKNRYPSLQREVDWGPEPEFKKGGSTTPEDMRHMMLAYGKVPQKYKDAYKNMSGFNKAIAAVGPADVAYELSQKRPGGAAKSAVETIAGATMPMKGFLPLMGATYASELGDATLDTYNANRQAETDERLSKSPVFMGNKMAPMSARDEIGRSPMDRALSQFYQEEGQNLMKYLK